MSELKPCRWLHFRAYTLDGNHHGPDHTPLRSTWQIVRMDSYAKTWTLYIYRKDARAHALTVSFPRWLGQWPAARQWPNRTKGQDSE